MHRANSVAACRNNFASSVPTGVPKSPTVIWGQALFIFALAACDAFSPGTSLKYKLLPAESASGPWRSTPWLAAQ